MLLTSFILLIVFSFVIAFFNPRLGLWLMLVVGLMADPVRKLTPRNPIIISLAFTLVFVVVYYGLVLKKTTRKNRIYDSFPGLRLPMQLFFIFLSINALRPLLADSRFLPLVALGCAQYTVAILTVQLGFYYVEDEKDVMRCLHLYIIAVLPFLCSVIFHFLGYDWDFLKTMGFWSGYIVYGPTGGVTMLNGLFRTPEPMGWHAMVAAICASFLLFIFLKKRNALPQKLYYTFIIALGLFCALVSGRRKMLLGVAVFIVTFLFLLIQKRGKKVFIFLSVIIMIGFLFIHMAEKARGLKIYLNRSETGFVQIGVESRSRTLSSIYWAMARDSIFGRGVGTTTQGAQHLDVKMVKKSGEAGPGKLISDVGIQGILALAAVMWVIFRKLSSRIGSKDMKQDKTATAIFLAALMIVHISSFGVAFQVYGDPLVLTLTGITFGFLLAMVKNTGESRTYA